MKAIEFAAELTGQQVLRIPAEIAAKLPKSGKARIIVLTSEEDEDVEDAEWRSGAYEQFLREDPPEDAVYDDY